MNIKPRTRDYWRECLAALQKSWPGLNETEIRKITQADRKKWASAYAKTASPTRYNNSVAILLDCRQRDLFAAHRRALHDRCGIAVNYATLDGDV